MSRFAIVDLETTGANSEGHKVTEVAIICVDDGVVSEEFTTLVNPERPIPWGITKLTGIDDDMVAQAPKFYSIAKKIVELTEGRTLVAHNAFFDYRFLQREFSELGFTFQREVLCTVRLARRAFPGLASYSLHNLSRHFGLTRLAEHRALDDARACHEVLKRVEGSAPSSLQMAATRPLPPGLDDGAIERLPCGAGTYFFYTQQGLLLYVGKAVNIRQRVRQHFQTAGTSKKDMELRQHVARVETLEWGSDLVASLMELQLIKQLKPLLNRASRRTHYRYTLTFHPAAAPGDEVRVSTTMEEEGGRWGARTSAEEARRDLYQAAFALEADGLFFQEKMRQYRAVLGDEVVIERLRQCLPALEALGGDLEIKAPGRRPGEEAFVVLRGGCLTEVRFIDAQGEVEIHPLENYPDMRRLVYRFVSASPQAR